MTPKVAPCNYAALLGEVFGIEPEAILTRWGFPDGHRRCACGRELHPTNQSGVCRPCQWERGRILVTCEECGTQFRRLESQIIYKMGKLDQDHIWCGKPCQGKWLGREHGMSRKYDYEAIWAMHLKTGYSGRRLAPLLGVPENAINYVLTRQRRILREQQADAMRPGRTA